jgi:hypothetical protein
MARIRTAALIALGMALSACGTAEIVTRSAPFEETPSVGTVLPSEGLSIASYDISVPRTLKATEAELFYPLADINWRGDPIGDRHAQVAAIFETSVMSVGNMAQTGRPVDVNIEVLRFHSLTNKARYTVGGVHSITFMLTATDPATGEIVYGPRKVVADLQAYGGQRAIEAEQRGITQKFRITNHLVKVIYHELTGLDAPVRQIDRVTASAPTVGSVTASGTMKHF